MHKTIIFKSPSAKIIFRVCVGVVLVVWLWALFFHTTQQATVDNTYCVKDRIVSIDAVYASHRGTDKLIIYTSEDSYTLEIGKRGKNATDSLKTLLLEQNSKMELRVWDHIPKHLLYPRKELFTVKQIVEIVNHGEVLWSIEKHNSFQHRERICGLIIFPFMTLFWLILTIDFTFVGIIRRKYRRIKKKIKAKKRKRQNNR